MGWRGGSGIALRGPICLGAVDFASGPIRMNVKQRLIPSN